MKLLIFPTSPPCYSYFLNLKYNFSSYGELHYLASILVSGVGGQMVNHIRVFPLRVVIIESVSPGHMSLIMLDCINVELLIKLVLLKLLTIVLSVIISLRGNPGRKEALSDSFRRRQKAQLTQNAYQTRNPEELIRNSVTEFEIDAYYTIASLMGFARQNAITVLTEILRQAATIPDSYPNSLLIMPKIIRNKNTTKYITKLRYTPSYR